MLLMAIPIGYCIIERRNKMYNPLGTDVIFEIKWFTESRYYFVKRGINQDWDAFRTDLYDYTLKRVEEILANECPAPYPLVQSSLSTERGILSISLDLNDISPNKKEEVISKIDEFARRFEDLIDFKKFEVPEVDDGVAYIGGEIFVKYSDKDAPLTSFFLMYDADKTKENIINSL